MFLSIEPVGKREFQPHPQGVAEAVCVDVFTREVTKNGETRTKLVLVFETDKKMEPNAEGVQRNFCLWDWFNLPQSLYYDNGALHKRVKQWGVPWKDYDSIEEFEQEVLGRPASLTIVHNTGESGETYDNIAACLPVEGAGFKATGGYTRQKDRD